jgi:hypothetical protein
LVVFIVCCVLGDPERLNDFLDGGVFQVIVSVLSITRWSVPMIINYQVEQTNPQPSAFSQQQALEAQKLVLHKGMWSIGYWWTGMFFLVLQGTVLRMSASLCLRLRNRDKQV